MKKVRVKVNEVKGLDKDNKFNRSLLFLHKRHHKVTRHPSLMCVTLVVSRDIGGMNALILFQPDKLSKEVVVLDAE